MVPNLNTAREPVKQILSVMYKSGLKPWAWYVDSHNSVGSLPKAADELRHQGTGVGFCMS